jgi:hypothetical protein
VSEFSQLEELLHAPYAAGRLGTIADMENTVDPSECFLTLVQRTMLQDTPGLSRKRHDILGLLFYDAYIQ